MKIQILSLPRTGSSYLRSMLNSQMRNYNNFYTISEPFNHSKNNIKSYKNKNKIIKNINKSNYILVKSHIYQLFDIDKLLLEKYCSVDWFTICLLRKNIFEMTLSRAIALKTNVWNNQKHNNLKINIDSGFFKNCLQDSVKWIQIMKQNHFNFNYNKIIYYEDLNFNSLDDLKILNISLPHVKLYESKKRYSKKKVVLNYNELFDNSIKFLKNVPDLKIEGVELKCL